MNSKVKFFFIFLFFLIPCFSNNFLVAEEFWDIPIKELNTLGYEAKIATDASGKYVYIVSSSETLNIQVSSDYGKTFCDSINLGSSSNLHAQITTNSSGQYVYLIWLENSKVFSSASSDYGTTFIDPIELGSCENSSSEPKITTSCDGQYVYAVWSDYNIQMRSSCEFGTRWLDKIELAPSGNSVEIITDSTGKYLYIIFADDDIQIRTSSDFGKSFTNSIRLDSEGETPKIATDATGQFVYAIWQDGSNNLQTRASDFGINWYPSIQFASLGTLTIKIVTSSDGKYVYTVWDDGNRNIRLKISSDFGRGFATQVLNEKGSHPNLITDSTGQYVFLIWLDTNFDIQFHYSTNFGVNFSSVIKLTNSQESNFTFPEMALNKDGKYIHILWNNQETGSIKIINGALLFSKHISLY